MNVNASAVGQILFIHLLVILFLTLKFAKGKSDNLPLVGIYSFLLSILFFPASWLYCWYWARKEPKVTKRL